MMKDHQTMAIILTGLIVFFATLVIVKFPEPYESALAVALAWMVGMWFFAKTGRKP